MLSSVAEMVEQPATHLLVLALVAVTCLLRQRCLGHAAVGLSYRAAVERGEWWRCVTCLFSHVDLLHLLNNTYSLLGNGGFIEEAYGTLAFLHTTALLCLVSIPVELAICHLLGPRHQATTVIGFSGVLFGQHTLLWHRGLASSPIKSLVRSHFLNTNASFVGHAAGIAAGCLVHHLHLTSWVPAVLSLGLMAAALLHAAATCPSISMPALASLWPCWPGSRVRLVGGCILRGTSKGRNSGPWGGTGRKLGGSGTRRIDGAADDAALPHRTAEAPRVNHASPAETAPAGAAGGAAWAGSSRKLGGGGSGMRHIAGETLPPLNGERRAGPAEQAATAQRPEALPASYRILRFGTDAPPSA